MSGTDINGRSTGAEDDSVIVVGAGLAGIACALHLAPLPVVLVAPPGAGQAASALAQGGIAAAVGGDDDPALHARDTLAAGAGLCDPETVARVTGAAPAMLDQLRAWGVPFDRDGEGGLALGLEAAHSRARILHAGGDATGRHVLSTLLDRLSGAAHVTRYAGTGHRLALRDGRVTGLWCVDEAGTVRLLRGRAVVLATGGLGALYASTSNPPGARGTGLALAARAGAVLRDMELVQFHPTALDVGTWPLPLVTEALRGAGARLVDERGAFLMATTPGGDLAPRDVVARAVHQEVAHGRRVFLDARAARVQNLPSRFPTVHALCLRHGIDPQRSLIPVRPAAHYHMGGIKVDGRGRSSVPGLYACGEAAATGLHGANRLASNSLLEALVFARWIADDVRATPATALPLPEPMAPPLPPELGSLWDGGALMDRHAGVAREADGLRTLLNVMLPRAETCDAALVAAFLARGALLREESRGGHMRRDFPRPAAPRHLDLTLDDVSGPSGSRSAPSAAATPRGAPYKDVA
ncbi:MAG: L-aspartate oxidase [Pseudomonadota bacterium]